MTDDELRAAFASLPPDQAGPCPPAERLWDAIEGDLAVEERRAVVDHLSVCAGCAARWRSARRLGARPPSVARALRRFRERIRPPWRSRERKNARGG